MIEMDLLSVLRSVIEYGPSVFRPAIQDKVKKWKTYLQSDNRDLTFDRATVSTRAPPPLILLDDVLSVLVKPDQIRECTEEQLITQVRQRIDASFIFIVSRFSKLAESGGSLLPVLDVSKRFSRVDKRSKRPEKLSDSGDDAVDVVDKPLADEEDVLDTDQRPTSHRRIIQHDDNPPQDLQQQGVDAVDTVPSPRHLFSSQQQIVASVPHGGVDPNRDGEGVPVSKDDDVAPIPDDGRVSPVMNNEQGQEKDQAQIEGEECIQIDSKRRRRSRKEMEGVKYVKNKHIVLAEYKRKRRPVVRPQDRLQAFCKEVMVSFADVAVSDELMKKFEEPDFGDGNDVHDNLSYYCDFQAPSDLEQYRLSRGDTRLAERICTWVRQVHERMGFDDIAAVVRRSAERVSGIKKELESLVAVGAASVHELDMDPRSVRCVCLAKIYFADLL